MSTITTDALSHVDESWFSSSDRTVVAERVAMAALNTTPARILKRLGEDLIEDVTATAAENPYMPAEALRVLASHPSMPVRYRVARNPSTPPDVLDGMVDDAIWALRYAVARNSAARADTLAKLVEIGEASRVNHSKRSSAGDALVNFVSRNPNTSVDVLHVLKADADTDIRVNVAAHPNATGDILRYLSRDPYARVVGVVAQCTEDVELLHALSKANSAQMRMIIVNNPHTGPNTLKALASNESKTIRKAVAAHPNTPAETLNRLAVDLERSVRKAVFTNVNYC